MVMYISQCEYYETVHTILVCLYPVLLYSRYTTSYGPIPVSIFWMIPFYSHWWILGDAFCAHPLLLNPPWNFGSFVKTRSTKGWYPSPRGRCPPTSIGNSWICHWVSLYQCSNMDTKFVFSFMYIGFSIKYTACSNFNEYVPKIAFWILKWLISTLNNGLSLKIECLLKGNKNGSEKFEMIISGFQF